MALDLEPQVTTTLVGAVDASGSPIDIVFVAPCNCTILGAYITDNTTKAEHADNHGHYALQNRGAAGTGTDVVASGDTITAGFTAYVPKALTMSTTVSCHVAKGLALALASTESGSATSGDLVKAAVSVVWVPGYGADV